MPVVTYGSLATTLAIDVVICAVVFVVFGFLRKTTFAKKFFGPKRFLSIPNRYRPHPLPDSLLFWWKPLLGYGDNEVYAIAGMDALAYHQYMRLGKPPFCSAPEITQLASCQCVRNRLV